MALGHVCQGMGGIFCGPQDPCFPLIKRFEDPSSLTAFPLVGIEPRVLHAVGQFFITEL